MTREFGVSARVLVLAASGAVLAFLAAPAIAVSAGSPLSLHRGLPVPLRDAAPVTRSATPKRITPAANLHPCKDAMPGGKCGRVRVPIDRAHPNRGKIGIFFEYYRHTGPGPTDEAIFASGGGPGFSATQDDGGLPDHLRNNVLTPLLETRDLVIFDQRGVGKSGAIDCKQLQHRPANAYRATRACARHLGFAASHYATRDIARDMEAIRKALGIDQINLWGGSYAPVDIQGYAARYPENVRSAVLEAPISMVDWDPLAGSVVDAMVRATVLVCERSVSCSDEVSNPEAEIDSLIETLRAEPVEGTARDASNRRHDVEVTEGILAWRIMQSFDGGYTPESELAAAANALAAGDEAPLLRLAAENDFPLYPNEGNPRFFSAGHFAARYCTDEPVTLWDKDAPISERRQQFAGAIAALPDGEFDPFSIDAWLAPLPVGFYAPPDCIVWPGPDANHEPPIPDGVELPADVPALILSGDLDYNTPSADSLVLQNAWDGSEFVEIANAGHFPSISPRFRCSAQILQDFIENLELGGTSCADDLDPVRFPGVGQFPVTAADATEASPHGTDDSTELDRKVAAVAAATVTDALRRTFIQQRTGRGPGLRGGTFASAFGRDKLGTELRNARFAKDVKVSGKVNYPYDTEAINATVEVEGPGDSDGSLKIQGVWFGFASTATVLEIDGTLGGRDVSLEVPAT
jgi:pimeloyl-ACP methyl ester carboxylesterase